MGKRKLTYEELEAENAWLRRRIAEVEVEQARFQGWVTELERQVTGLTRQVAETLRTFKRQAAPFSKGEPKAAPSRPGRKKGLRESSRRLPVHLDEVVWGASA